MLHSLYCTVWSASSISRQQCKKCIRLEKHSLRFRAVGACNIMPFLLDFRIITAGNDGQVKIFDGNNEIRILENGMHPIDAIAANVRSSFEI